LTLTGMFRVLSVLLPLVLAACSSAGGGSAGGSASSAAAVPSAFASAVPGPTSSADYRIAPLDILDISVFQVPDLTKTVQVSSSGQISLPLIGTVQAGGKSPQDLEKQIAGVLGAKYLQSPQVSVFVKEYTSQKVTVEGAVIKPGIYPMSGKTTLLQAIALAGGLDRVADSRGIVVFREAGGKKQAAKFDLPSIRSGKADDPVIAGGDVVVVDQDGGKTALRGVRESLGIFGLFSPIL
jgi:polysaccharide export outer membrane protein